MIVCLCFWHWLYSIYFVCHSVEFCLSHSPSTVSESESSLWAPALYLVKSLSTCWPLSLQVYKLRRGVMFEEVNNSRAAMGQHLIKKWIPLLMPWPPNVNAEPKLWNMCNISVSVDGRNIEITSNMFILPMEEAGGQEIWFNVKKATYDGHEKEATGCFHIALSLVSCN